MSSRAWLAVAVLVVIFTVIVVYEWSGAWRGYKTTLGQAENVTPEVLEEKRIPLYMLVVVTLVDYVKHSRCGYWARPPGLFSPPWCRR